MLKSLRDLFGRKRRAELEAEKQERAELLTYIRTLSEHDIGVITLLCGYWWKFGEGGPDVAFLRAIQTLKFINGQDETMRASAMRSAEETMKWAKSIGREATEIGTECLALAIASTVGGEDS